MLLAIDITSFALGRSGWRRFASTFLLFYSQIIGTEFLLGTFSVLYSYSLAALNLLVSSCITAVLWRKFGKRLFTTYLEGLRKLPAKLWNDLRGDPMGLIVLALVAVFLAWIVFLGVIFPATDFDGNSYHLTFIGNLIQNHNFYDVQTSLSWLVGYPKGGEFIQAWSVLMTHNDMFADISQLPFVALGVYALYQVAVRVGVSKNNARFAALLFVFLPVVLNQLKTTYVDVMLASLFFAGLSMVVQKKLSRLDLALVGIIFSLILAVKSTGLLFVCALIPLLLWNLYQAYGKSYKQYIRPLILIVSPTFFGLYWYVKNIILYGTPLYPFSVQVGGITLFPGKNFQDFVNGALQTTALPHGCVQRVWFVWTEQKDWFGCLYNYDTNYAGLGPIWFIILIPAIIVSVYFAIKKRSVLYAAVATTVLALFIAYPANYYSRYTMFVTAVGILALGLVLSNVHKITSALTKGATAILVLSVISTNFVLCNFAPKVVASQLVSILGGSKRGTIYENMPGEAFVILEGRIQPHEVVAYDSSPYFIYPLWRPDFSNTVLYLPAHNKAEWQEQLRSRHVKYMFTTVGSRENRWAQDSLRDIYKDQMYEIFQVN